MTESEIMFIFYTFDSGAGNKKLKRDRVAPFITVDNSAFVTEPHDLHQDGSVLLLLYRESEGEVCTRGGRPPNLL